MMRRSLRLHTISAKLRLASVAVVVILVLGGAVGWSALSRLSAEIEQQVKHAAAVEQLTLAFTTAIATQLRAGERYMVTPEPGTREIVERSRQEAHRLHATLVRLTLAGGSATDPADAVLVARIDRVLSRLEVTLAMAHRLRDLGDPAAAKVLARGGILEEELRADMQLLSEHQSEDIIRLGRELRHRAVTRAAVLGVVLSVAALLVLLVNWQVTRSVTGPLRALVARAHAFERDGADQHMNVSRMPGEYQILGEAMNRAGDAIVALRETQTSLHRAEKLAAIGTLISGVAHELNNPLQTILLTTENLDAPRLHSEAAADIATIREQVVRASAIIRDLLTSVRSEVTVRQAIDLRTLLQLVERELEELAARSGCRLTVSIAPDLPPRIVDQVGMSQVLTNLVRNAAHAAGEGGRVWVEALAAPAGCELRVEDSGPGIDSDTLRRVFEPLFTTKPEGQGTGLGLPVSRGLVERMGGELVAEGRAGPERPGARFRVLLPPIADAAHLGEARRAPQEHPAIPALTASPAPASPAEPPRGAVGEDRARILIIDDEPAIRRSLQRFFERRGWLVNVAADGLEALAILDSHYEDAFAVILSDVRMPTMNGIELHDVLQSRGTSSLGRLVVLSGDLVSTEVAAFVARTRCPVLSKPIDLAALLSTAEATAAAHRRATPPLTGAAR